MFGKKYIDLGDCLRPLGSQLENHHHYGTFRDLYEPSGFHCEPAFWGRIHFMSIINQSEKQGHRSAVNLSIWRSPTKKPGVKTF